MQQYICLYLSQLILISKKYSLVRPTEIYDHLHVESVLALYNQDLHTKFRFGGNSIMMADIATAGGNSSCVAHNATLNPVSINSHSVIIIRELHCIARLRILSYNGSQQRDNVFVTLSIKALVLASC